MNNYIEDWNKFVLTVMVSEGETNFKNDFKWLTRYHGRCYMDYLKAAYSAKDILTDEQFCYLNHCPLTILPKLTNN